MQAKYERESKYRGIPTLRYHLDLGDIAVSNFDYMMTTRWFDVSEMAL